MLLRLLEEYIIFEMKEPGTSCRNFAMFRNISTLGGKNSNAMWIFHKSSLPKYREIFSTLRL